MVKKCNHKDGYGETVSPTGYCILCGEQIYDVILVKKGDRIVKLSELKKEIERLKKIKIGDNCSPEGIRDLFLDALLEGVGLW